MQKKKLSLIIGVALSVGAIVLLNLYLQTEKEKSTEQLKRAFTQEYKDLTSVMVAKQDIPRGTTLSSKILKSEVVPARYVQPGAVTSLSRVEGKKVVASIKKGEQITMSKLSGTAASAAGPRTLAMSVPSGKRAITVKIDNIASLAGMLRPNDYVDVIALLPTPVQTPEGTTTQITTISLFQNIRVIAVGGELAVEEKTTSTWGGLGKPKAPPKSKVSPLITLALTPEEANLLSFVTEQGRIRLVLRSPADAAIQPLAPASWDTLFRYINSKFIRDSGKEDEKGVEEPKQIEIYRGTKKEYMTISE